MMQLNLLDLVRAGSSLGLKKAFTEGTHREWAPEHLLTSLSQELSRFNISRIARITDLDRIGIEVYTVVRPNSYGLSVTQGKGVDRPTAQISGIMEAVEYWYAEHPENALFLAPSTELVRRFPDGSSNYWAGIVDPARRILWTNAIDLVTGDEMPVPFDLVHANFDGNGRGFASGLVANTNGLASGGNAPEAVTHALCETIERHATFLFGSLSPAERAARALNLGSIDDLLCRSLIDRCSDAGVGLKVWDATCEIAVPSFIACLSDQRDAQMPPGFGAGCHPARGVALSRAITEAAQSRLTRISGARDDLALKFYSKIERTRAKFLLEQDNVAQSRIFVDTPDCASNCLVEDFRRVLARLRAAGHGDAFAVTLAHNKKYCVVRVIVPSLFGLEDAM